MRVKTRLARLLLCALAGCGPVAASPPAREIALAKPPPAPLAKPDVAHPSSGGVSLEPAPPGQYEIWRLRNGGPEAIAPDVPVAPAPVAASTDRAGARATPPSASSAQALAFFGHFERLTPESDWASVQRGSGCLSVGAELESLPPDASHLVGELPPLGARDPLAPGSYRFVVGYRDAAHPDQAWQVRAPFEVRALGEDEATALFAALARPELRACPAAFAEELHAFVASAPPSHLPRLLDLPARTLDERLGVLRALSRFRDLRRLFAWAIGTADPQLAIAASIIVTEAPWCEREPALCEAATAQLVGSLARSRLEVAALDALATAPQRWPAKSIEKLIAALEAAASDPIRRALARALLAAGVERLDGRAHDAIRALRRAATQTRDATTRAALASSADEIEGGRRDRPPAAAASPELGTSSPTEEDCAPLLASVSRLTRFVGARSVPMTVLHDASSVDPTPAPP